MKQIVYTIIVLILCSCNNYNSKYCGSWVVLTNDRSGFQRTIVCDSLNLENTNKATVYINGRGSVIYAAEIIPTYIPCY